LYFEHLAFPSNYHTINLQKEKKIKEKGKHQATYQPPPTRRRAKR